MSYQGRGNGGYGQVPPAGNPYGANPYAQQDPGSGSYGQPSSQYNQQSANPYPRQQSYNQQAPGRQQQPQPGYGSNDVEMGPVNGSSGGYQDPNAILNECRDVDRGIDSIEQHLEQLRVLQQKSLTDADSSQDSPTNRQLDKLSTDTMAIYHSLARRVKSIKTKPESSSPKNAPQVGKVDRRLKNAINQYQTVDRDFRRQLQSQLERQYRIVRPDASDAEVREAVEDTSNTQIFSQALMQSDRRGQAQSALRNVSDRHEAISKIERQMVELAELFQDMEALVVQQEPMVDKIEQQGAIVEQDVSKANDEIAGAITKARSRNRKKWWCLLIVVLIVIIVVGVAVGVVEANKKK